MAKSLPPIYDMEPPKKKSPLGPFRPHDFKEIDWGRREKDPAPYKGRMRTGDREAEDLVHARKGHGLPDAHGEAKNNRPFRGLRSR